MANDSTSRRGPWPWVFVALIALIPAGIALALGVWPDLQLRSARTAQAASFVHYGLIGWTVAVLALIIAVFRARFHWAAALLLSLAIAGCATQATWIAPNVMANTQPHGKPLRVVSLNLEYGMADPDQTVAQLRQADIALLQEVTPAAAKTLSDKGLGAILPHRLGKGAEGVNGTTIHSRYPLTELEPIPTLLESRLARVATPAGPIVVASVHPVNPMSGPVTWNHDGQVLRAALRPHLGERLVVGGDFNAIDRHLTMINLTADGLRNAADLTGTGYRPTWPVNAKGSPVPLITIDHVLVSRSMTATDLRTFTVSDTDHAGLICDVAPLE